jgi:hypothetical protein
VPEADDTQAVGDTRDPGIEPTAGELSVPAGGVAVPDAAVDRHDDAAVQVPDEGVTVPEVTLEPPKVSMPPLPETGESRVDAAVAPLRDLGDQPTEEHVGGYEAAHTGLQDVLADLDRDPDGNT